MQISIHALREEGDGWQIVDIISEGLISIHALREEGDAIVLFSKCAFEKISIHALREEGDDVTASLGTSPTYFYPRPPRGGRLFTLGNIFGFRAISIHALREEGDPPASEPGHGRGGFLSTPSARRATASQVEATWREV